MSPQRIVRYVDRHPWRTVLFIAGLLFVGLGVSMASNTANKAENAAHTANRAIVQIQVERARSVREGCIAQNLRNAAAYAFLKRLPTSTNQPRRTPAQQEALIHGFTDALVGPVRDCDEVVREVVPSK